MKDLIKALKENVKPFGLMTEEMQAKILSVEYRHVEHFAPGSSWDRLVMAVEKYDDHETWTFRLRPDYTEEPEIVRCEVSNWGGDMCDVVRFLYTNSCTYPLRKAVGFDNFIGFEYKDGMVDLKPRLYKSKGNGYYGNINLDNFSIGEYEVLTPTHVLFRKATT